MRPVNGLWCSAVVVLVDGSMAAGESDARGCARGLHLVGRGGACSLCLGVPAWRRHSIRSAHNLVVYEHKSAHVKVLGWYSALWSSRKSTCKYTHLMLGGVVSCNVCGVWVL